MNKYTMGFVGTREECAEHWLTQRGAGWRITKRKMQRRYADDEQQYEYRLQVRVANGTWNNTDVCVQTFDEDDAGVKPVILQRVFALNLATVCTRVDCDDVAPIDIPVCHDPRYIAMGVQLAQDAICAIKGPMSVQTRVEIIAVLEALHKSIQPK
jgi:hypothetical protein